VCLENRGQLWIFKECCRSARDGHFDGDHSLGEGVNLCLVPPPPHRIARRTPKARVKTMAEAWTPKGKYILFCRSARDGCFDGDCGLGGGGWSAVSPSPLPDRSSLAKTRVKTLAGFFGLTPIRCVRPRPHPAPNQEKRTEKLWRAYL
jgi:hypothetical protein